MTGLDATDGRRLCRANPRFHSFRDDANRGCTIMMTRDEVVPR